MKKLFAILALALLLVPGIVFAQPAGCTWERRPCRYVTVSETRPCDWAAGTTSRAPITRDDLSRRRRSTTRRSVRTPQLIVDCHGASCKARGYLLLPCSRAARAGQSRCNPADGRARTSLDSRATSGTRTSTITAPCDAAIGDRDTLIAIDGLREHRGRVRSRVRRLQRSERASGDRPSCYYSADTLIVTVVAAPPALGILQDTLTLVERGQTQAYIPFTICNQDECAPPTLYSYNITSKGHVGVRAINTTGIGHGRRRRRAEDVYGIINAGVALACDYDTLTIIVWTPAPVVYDTCVQVIHVIEPVAGAAIHGARCDDSRARPHSRCRRLHAETRSEQGLERLNVVV